MRLAPRLVIAFGLVATLSVAGLGYVVREDRRESETARFEHEVGSACHRVTDEIARQGESDRKLIAGACQSGELADRALIWMEAGTLDSERRLALSRLVPEERRAFDLDELVLATTDGDVLGADPMTAIEARAHVRSSAGNTTTSALVRSPEPALAATCRKDGQGGRGVLLAGARRIGPVVKRLGKTLEVGVALDAPPARKDEVAEASCKFVDGAGSALAVFVDKPKTELKDNLARIDRTTLYAAIASTGVAMMLAVLLARSLGRPIADLAAEARKVARGAARPLRVGGPREIAELAHAFDTMLLDLEATRRRLAATSRVAAWREVARRVAHEIKNPLAPIRAAVETLRRLRARDDPEFYAYFDEATRTVLAEVHRISNIVTEFTRFARLSPPRPKEVDVAELARQDVRLHEANAPGARLSVTVVGKPPNVRADPDQIIQVLTNLVQNALEAAAEPGVAAPEVRVIVEAEGDARAVVTVTDNGPGVSPQIVAHLFEPYATTKEHGTGLGLAIAQRIALEHDGELAYAPTPAGGASFRLVLPVEGPPVLSSDRVGAG